MKVLLTKNNNWRKKTFYNRSTLYKIISWYIFNKNKKTSHFDCSVYSCACILKACDLFIDTPFPFNEHHHASADGYENVMTRLGLTERKSSPDPIKFNENDPLGSKLMQNSKTNASTVIESLSKCVI